MWEDLIQKAKDGGLDVVETYVFWNGHEPSPGNVLHSLFSEVPILFFCLSFSIAELYSPCSASGSV